MGRFCRILTDACNGESFENWSIFVKVFNKRPVACFFCYRRRNEHSYKQESPAIADKPARRERLPKIAPIRRAYNVVADNIGLSSFV